jgi:hypothetical protein
MDVDTSDESPVASTFVDDASSKEELPVGELWEARWATNNTRFKKVFTDDFGLEAACAIACGSPKI